jgi:hypothetical protein
MKYYQGKSGGFISQNMGSIVVSLVITAIAYFLLSFVSPNEDVVFILSLGIFYFMWNIYPILIISDVASDIPEIAEYNNDREEKISVPHPLKDFIFILSVAGFFTGGLTTLVALYMASGSFNAEIADNISEKITRSKQSLDSEQV